jgi:hypothetical protein
MATALTLLALLPVAEGLDVGPRIGCIENAVNWWIAIGGGSVTATANAPS